MSNASTDTTITIVLASRSPLIDARDRVRELLQPAADVQDILMDATGLEFISRSAASELLAAVARWKQEHRSVHVRNVAPTIAKMFRAVDPSVEIE
ncbi:STAS domain-containing protein [Candidatus Uhrbacteria bacterium]|nr:STAS domain-containing protein [Candidatus Uhrbacteria bacterium]